MGFKRILSAARFPDWWDFKIPPLLGLGYATIYHAGYAVIHYAPHLLFLLVSLVVGATYVSVINDITDINDDTAIGKPNRMTNIPAKAQWALVACLVGAGFVFACLMRHDLLTLACYAIPWIAFTLYSVPPVRLKEKGFWGVLCDSSGAHLFPSLLMVAGMSFAMHTPVDWYWFTIVGLWALPYGLRGILWHQYVDLENDIETKTNTFATTVDSKNAHALINFTFLLEIFGLTLIISYLLNPLILLFLGCYLLLVLLRYHHNKQIPVLAITPTNKPYQIVLADYYQFFLPISILLTQSLDDPNSIVILILHLALFPKKLKDAARDVRNFIWKYA